MIKEKQISIAKKDFKQASFLFDTYLVNKDKPDPTKYKPKHAITEQARYNGVGFGIGDRYDPLLFPLQHKPVPGPKLLVNVPESYVRNKPGPGAHRIPS